VWNCSPPRQPGAGAARAARRALRARAPARLQRRDARGGGGAAALHARGRGLH
jgi:hypothetical protein